MNIPANANATRKGEDCSKEELEALRAEAEEKKPEPEEEPAPAPAPDPEPEEKKVDEEKTKSVLQAAQIAMAASSAL